MRENIDRKKKWWWRNVMYFLCGNRFVSPRRIRIWNHIYVTPISLTTNYKAIYKDTDKCNNWLTETVQDDSLPIELDWCNNNHSPKSLNEDHLSTSKICVEIFPISWIDADNVVKVFFVGLEEWEREIIINAILFKIYQVLNAMHFLQNVTINDPFDRNL